MNNVNNIYISKRVMKICGIKSAFVLAILKQYYEEQTVNSSFVYFNSELINDIKEIPTIITKILVKSKTNRFFSVSFNKSTKQTKNTCRKAYENKLVIFSK